MVVKRFIFLAIVLALSACDTMPDVFGEVPSNPTSAALYYATQAAKPEQDQANDRPAQEERPANDTAGNSDIESERIRLENQQQALRATEQVYAAWGTGTVEARQAAIDARNARSTLQAQKTLQQDERNVRQTQQAWDFQMMGGTATADKSNYDRSSTADAASVQALQTADAAQAQVAAEKAYQEQLKSERMRTVNEFAAWAPYGIGLLIGLALAGAFWFWRRHQVIPRDASGAAPLVRIGDRLLDADRSLLPVLDPARPVQSDREAHLRITENAQKVQAVRAGLLTKSNAKEAIKLVQPPAQAPVQAAPANTFAGPHSAASWQIFTSAPGPVPLGIGQDGSLMQPDPDEWPHRLFAGMTGAGKSRHGIRPYIAGALVRGWGVVAIGDMPPVDFNIFNGHHNYHRLVLDDLADAIPYTVAINREIRERWLLLDRSGASTWDRLSKAAPHVAIVFDEFASMVDDLDPSERMEFTRQVTNISRLARKVGVHLVCGVQNPTADNIRPSIRRNLLPVAFRVVDATASRVILESDGAEKLTPPEYLVRMHQVVPGLGFDPSDEQIADYLASRPVPAYDPPAFLLQPPENTPGADSDILRLAETIRPAWERGDSKRGMARAAGKDYAGWFAGQIDRAIEYLAATTTPKVGEVAGQAD